MIQVLYSTVQFVVRYDHSGSTVQYGRYSVSWCTIRTYWYYSTSYMKVNSNIILNLKHLGFLATTKDLRPPRHRWAVTCTVVQPRFHRSIRHPVLAANSGSFLFFCRRSHRKLKFLFCMFVAYEVWCANPSMRIDTNIVEYKTCASKRGMGVTFYNRA